MARLTIDVLQSIVEKLPKDFEVEFKDIEGSVSSVSDEFTVKVDEKKLVLKFYLKICSFYNVRTFIFSVYE